MSMNQQFKELAIPVSVIGPGSQPNEEDGMELDYMHMPKGMSVFHAPIIMDDELSSYPAAEAVLKEMQTHLNDPSCVQFTRRIDLNALRQEDVHFINKFLGEGEVAAIVETDVTQRIQETVLAGVWRVSVQTDDGFLDYLEVGAVPLAVQQDTFGRATDHLEVPQDVTQLPEGVINSPSVLNELNNKSFEYRHGDESHVINLTLLPQSPEDLNYLNAMLGIGETVFLSRGYGSCRITATQLKHVWWVQFFNSEDALILNTLEVIDVPIVAMASLEDLEDSAERLIEMMESVA